MHSVKYLGYLVVVLAVFSLPSIVNWGLAFYGHYWSLLTQQEAASRMWLRCTRDKDLQSDMAAFSNICDPRYGTTLRDPHYIWSKTWRQAYDQIPWIYHLRYLFVYVFLGCVLMDTSVYFICKKTQSNHLHTMI